MNKLKAKLLLWPTLALMSSALAANGQSPSISRSSAENSLRPDTVAKIKPRNATNACSAAADDLIATRRLAEALDSENIALRERLESEKQIVGLLRELAATAKAENESLRTAVAAKNETIAAKDGAIAAQEKLIGELKRKRSSPWRRLGDILIGAAAGALLK